MRQVALVGRDLAAPVNDLCAVLDLQIAYRDPGVEAFGLHNALLPIGDTFLEVVSPLRPDTSAGRLLDRRKGDGGYMVIVQSEDLEADRKRMAEVGVRDRESVLAAARDHKLLGEEDAISICGTRIRLASPN